MGTLSIKKVRYVAYKKVSFKIEGKIKSKILISFEWVNLAPVLHKRSGQNWT